MKKLLVLLMCILFLPDTFLFAAAEEETLTVMVYLCGSNLESGSFAATSDLLEMMEAGFDGKRIQLLVMAGGTEKWGSSIPVDCLPVYLIRSHPKRGSSMVMVHAFEDMSMGSPDALSAFLDYGYTEYSAQHYALIMWDHGGGSLEGVCMDTRHDKDMLTMPELYTALQNSPVAKQKLDFIGFDACLMASVEVAAIVSPFAHYMIASQEREPGSGWDYRFLAGIDPSAPMEENGRLIVDTYLGTPEDDTMTLSCINLDWIPGFVSKINNSFNAVEIDGETYLNNISKISSLTHFGKSSVGDGGYDLFDLGSVLDVYFEADIPQMLQNVVVYSGSVQEGCSGLTIYHPFINKNMFLNQWRGNYHAMNIMPNYAGYLERFTSFLFGKTAATWRMMRTKLTEAGWQLQLDQDQMLASDSAALYILRHEASKNAYLCTYMGNQISADEGGLLTERDPEVRLGIADDDGRILIPELGFEREDDDSLRIYVNYARSSALDSDEAGAVLRNPVGGKGITISGTESAEWVGPASTPAATQQPNLTLSKQIVQINAAVLPELNMNEEYWFDEELYQELAEEPEELSDGAEKDQPHQEGGLAVKPQIVIVKDHSYQEKASVPLSSFMEPQIQILPDDMRITLSEKKEVLPDVMHGFLLCSVNDKNGEISISSRYVFDTETGTYTNRLGVETLAYDFLVFPLLYRICPEENENGLPAFSAWDYLTDSTLSISTNENWHFVWVKADEMSQETAAFEVTDVQNERHFTYPAGQD